MKLNFLKKIFVISIILIIQGIFLYAFYINEGLIFNFKASYLTKVYLPSYIQSLNNFKLDANNYLASMVSAFNDTRSDSVSGQFAKSIPVLLYHGIVEKPDGANVLIDNFREQMFALKKAGWQTVSIDDFYQFMKGEKILPDKSFLLTFDDGRKDSYYPVDPILKALDYNAVIFVITKYSLEDKSGNYYLSKSELRQMIKSGRWEVEAHTRDGHNVYKISPDGKQGHFYSNKLWLDNENRLEIEEEFTNRIKSDFVVAKNDIEQGLGTKVISFAYPFGDFGQNSANFPKAESIITDIAHSIYGLSFYQVWPGKGFSFNYPNENNYLIKRIEIKPDWNFDNLLAVLNAAIEKNLPYIDNFASYNGWIKTWGKLILKNNSIVMGAHASTAGSAVFLDGTYLWQNYVFKADVRLMKGQSFSLTARYKDGKNYTACSFSDKLVRIEQVLNGEKKVLSELKGDFVFIGKNRDVGIGVYDNIVICYLDDKMAVISYNLDQGLDRGGIGFKTWDPQLNNSELIIKSVSVEEIK